MLGTRPARWNDCIEKSGRKSVISHGYGVVREERPAVSHLGGGGVACHFGSLFC